MLRVLIVDDEIHTKEAIELMLEWDKYGVEEVYYARNGSEAKDLIGLYRPDILFCDMEMPVMGGKELLDWIVGSKIDIQVIAVSGYSDFEYVHATLIAGGIDYILKPFSQEALEDAMGKAVLRIRGEEENKCRMRQHLKMGIAMSNQIMQDLCDGKTVEDQELGAALSKLGAEETDFLVISILNRNADEIIEERYDGDRELFFFTTGNILKDVFSKASFCQDVFSDDFLWFAFIQEEAPDPLKVSGKMKIFEKKAQEYLGLSVTYVVSSGGLALEKLSEAVFEQKRLLTKRSIWGSAGAQEGRVSADSVPSVLSMELVLSSIMKKRDRHALRETITRYCRELKDLDGMKVGMLQNCTADMNLLLRRLGENISAGSDARIEMLSLWIGDIDVWEQQVLQRLELLLENYETEAKPAERIFAYIREHYSEDITLSSIAQNFYQSPQYIARIFRNEYGMTVTMAVTQVRIERACSLLENGMSTAQVAEMVGYEDENYFRRVFKKQTGTTPAQYKRCGE